MLLPNPTVHPLTRVGAAAGCLALGMTTALIDGDLVAYRCAAANEEADLGLAIWQTDQMIARILEDVNADNWFIFISGDNNFRYNIYPDYKANRRNQPRPKHLEGVREYLVSSHNADIADGYEADDSLGIARTRLGVDNNVICSLDKDLLQLEGQHYNFVKRTFERISRWDGLRNFYTQLLVGDSTDNIRGCPGIGKAKAPKLLEGCNDESDLVRCCWESYERAGSSEDFMIMNAKLLYILREEGDAWKPPLDLILE